MAREMVRRPASVVIERACSRRAAACGVAQTLAPSVRSSSTKRRSSIGAHSRTQQRARHGVSAYTKMRLARPRAVDGVDPPAAALGVPHLDPIRRSVAVRQSAGDRPSSPPTPGAARSAVPSRQPAPAHSCSRDDWPGSAPAPTARSESDCAAPRNGSRAALPSLSQSTDHAGQRQAALSIPCSPPRARPARQPGSAASRRTPSHTPGNDSGRPARATAHDRCDCPRTAAPGPALLERAVNSGCGTPHSVSGTCVRVPPLGPTAWRQHDRAAPLQGFEQVAALPHLQRPVAAPPLRELADLARQRESARTGALLNQPAMSSISTLLKLRRRSAALRTLCIAAICISGNICQPPPQILLPHTISAPISKWPNSRPE